ncbi:DNA double-strand break repair ATPase Rad50 [Thermococcus sp. 18S1]|uniref:DNA double-strand break repair ATPase Rad50 n=1 Tax=Thermococcus sp. 18S1 TaxID=1638210 RepID=UPI00143BE4D8|nr:DNA double-strand break repair ATPase Rad50 [Thermococcus sp. 18S1]NJE31467.1 DNA double-strand break repair ATPase Rad50 [Thermococcus sp. 18S1]
MRIRRIKIRNFRAHERSEIEFSDGINLLIGQNGAGKSSILEAIFAALYMGHPSFPRGYIQANTRVNSTGGLGLTLEFEHNGKSYRIVRDSKKSELLEDREMIAEKSSNVARWVERNVYPIQVFTNALYIRQGEIEGIITNREVMEKVLRKVLGIEDYENAERNAADVIRELKRRREYLRKLIERKAEVEENLRDAEKRFSETLRRISELRKRVGELEGAFRKAEEDYSRLKALKSELEGLEKRRAVLEQRIKAEKGRIEDYEVQIEEVKKEIGELEDKLARLKELEPLEKEYMKLKSLLSLKNELAKLETAEARLTEKRKALEERAARIDDVSAKMAELEGEEKSLRETYEELKRKNGLYQRALQRKAEAERYLRELERAGVTPESLEEELKAVENAKKELENLREEVTGIREEIATLKGLKESLIENLSKLEGARVCPLCKRPIEEHDEEEIRAEYDAEITSIEKKLNKLSKKLKKLNEREIELKGIIKRESKLIRLKKTADLLREVKEKLAKYDLEELEKAAEEFEKAKARLIEIKKELRHLREELEELEKAKDELGRIEKKLQEMGREKRRILERLENEGFGSFEAVEERMKELEPAYREYLSLKNVPAHLERTKKKLSLLEKRRDESIKALRKLEGEFKELGAKMEKLSREFSEEAYAEAEKRYMTTARELEKARTELKGAEELRDEVMKLLDELKAKRKEIEGAEKELETVEKAMADMTAFKEKVARLKAEEELRGLEEVQKLAGETFSEMTEGKYQGIKLKREKKFGKERIELKVLYAGNEVGLEFLSGGERIALGLAFRLALSLYKVGNLELLILDEPTPFLDEERRKKLVEIISSQLRKIPQVIIVSHDEELKDAADYVIRVLNVGGKSRVEVESIGAY